MALELKHVADLMGMNFCIPSYQRGYRWERKQIEQLLNDLAEFSQRVDDAEYKGCSAEIGYYCLQPLAVVEKAGDGKCAVYDVIDGQQRLTTIYLILSYFVKSEIVQKLPWSPLKKLDESMYTLVYESRDEGFFKEKRFVDGGEESKENIDFYFMTKGYEVISNWFKKNQGYISGIKELLLPAKYHEGDAKNDRFSDVRFIWYKVEGDAIQTFNNLNFGKIGLTPAELVKAILFECDQYKDEDRKIAREKAFSRSLKWSMMEEHLQDEFFWGMLVSGRKYEDLHLGLILKFVADGIDKKREYTQKEHWDKDDSDWVFNVFYKAVSDQELKDENGAELTSASRRVDYLWDRIQNVYTVFCNWFNDRELYHWIGLYVFISVNYGKKVHEKVIQELFELYHASLKNNFKVELKRKIGRAVRINVKNENGDALKKLEELRYPDEDSSDKVEADTIRKILLLFNVEMTLANSQDESRFPFHLASRPSLELKSIEHIHPQNLKNEELEFGVAKEWFEVRREKLQSVKDCDLKCAIDYLQENLVEANNFEENKADILKYLNVIDRKFDELAGMKPEVMHSLRNLALVDGPTNAALGNKLLDEKRQVLISRTNEKVTYVPLGTWYVFNKHFSNSPSDLKFWSKADRDAYFNQIEQVYNRFVTL